jgi:hypothetical protein
MGVPYEPREIVVEAMKKCELNHVLICASSFGKHVFWAEGIAMCHVIVKSSLGDRLSRRIRYSEVCWADMPQFSPLVEVSTAQQSFPVCNASNIPSVKKLALWLKEQGEQHG